jgi:3-dehydroquinate synthase
MTMKTISIKSNKPNGKESKILIEESMERILKLIGHSSSIIAIIDKNVNQLYPELMADSPKIFIHAEESNKTLDTVGDIYEKLIKLGADRHVFLLGVGGGIVCDIVGYVASTYMRGVRFGFIATTLMAQVDAAIGGKNGVNVHRYKNMVGTFNLPEFVCCDLSMLATLPTHEINTGFAEIIKYGLIENPSILDFIEENINNISILNYDVYKQLIEQCVMIKAGIVNADLQDKGVRRILNFGHTLAHAIEKHTSLYNHGEAVSIGIVASLMVSYKKGHITTNEIDRVKRLLQHFNLPIEMEPKLLKSAIEEIVMDKKRNQDSIDFIILTKIGHAQIFPIAIGELKPLLLSSL